jgi:hypothetical protein
MTDEKPFLAHMPDLGLRWYRNGITDRHRMLRVGQASLPGSTGIVPYRLGRAVGLARKPIGYGRGTPSLDSHGGGSA